MTKDEIISMAREAGIEKLHIKRDGEKHSILDLCYPELERFYKLAFEAGAKHEREACAKVCEEYANVKPFSDFSHGSASGADMCAAAIRERGETK